MNNSFFIVIEGAHGSGKTTQAKLLEDYLNKKQITTVYTKEPFLKEIKALVKANTQKSDNLNSLLMVYLHAADRIIHLNYILEKLKSNYVVVTDRYFLSSCIYQQIQGLSIDFIENVNRFCIEPNITFILNVDSTNRRERLERSDRIRNSLFFDSSNFEIEDKLYRDLFQRYKRKWKKIFLINGMRDVRVIFQEITSLFDKNYLPGLSDRG